MQCLVELMDLFYIIPLFTCRYNIFWSEMTKLQKLCHLFKQIPFFFLLPLAFLLTTIIPRIEKISTFHSLIIQTHIPVNRFIYFEMSKFLFVLIIFLTMVDREEVAWYDLLAVLWIFSYILEDFRTIYRLYDQGGAENRSKTVRRWLTFKAKVNNFASMYSIYKLLL